MRDLCLFSPEMILLVPMMMDPDPETSGWSRPGTVCGRKQKGAEEKFRGDPMLGTRVKIQDGENPG